jgi:hypothetical protein
MSKIEADRRTRGFAASGARPFIMAFGRQAAANAFFLSQV